MLLLALMSAPKGLAEDKMKAGKAALERKDYLAAISAFRDAVNDDKKNLEGYLLLATALIKADSLEPASVVLFQAREVDTSSAQIYEVLGDVYAAQKIVAAAADQSKSAVPHDSTKAGLWLKLADANKRSRLSADAAGAYSHVLALDSTNRSEEHTSELQS